MSEWRPATRGGDLVVILFSSFDDELDVVTNPASGNPVRFGNLDAAKAKAAALNRAAL